ncbi:MAG: DUF4037 domain-containing protein [Chloroflexi bacterium]|nr:DUF4037 domain-containing protein [Chloroflexota bacterium]
MTDFIPGLDLNEQFYGEQIRPLLAEKFPGLLHSAARLGDGSDVLGFDDEMSTDHDWGIRQQIFLAEADFGEWATAVTQTLSHHLPYQYRGYSVHFGPEDEEGVRLQADISTGPVTHMITVACVPEFFQKHLGIDPTKTWDAVDWLSVPQQKLKVMSGGRLFADDLGILKPLQQKLVYFPHEVWLYLLACQWRRIGQEDHFLGRTGFLGDDIGSRLLAGRLVHDVMMLGFLYKKVYAPYPKWFGTAFQRLDCAAALGPILQNVLTADSWQERETHLCTAFKLIGEIHNRLQITPPLPTGCEQFHGRPFRIHTGAYVETIRAAITAPDVLTLPPYLGSIDQFSDNTDLRSYPEMFERLRPLYQT